MNEAQLRDALEKASAHFDARQLAQRALEERSRRLRHRRALVAGLVVLAFTLPSVFLNRDDRSADTVDSPQPTVTPIDEIPAPESQPIWDPFTITEAPTRDSVLPDRLVPPDASATITDDPLPDIAVAWPTEGRDLRLLGSNGEWRSVPGTATAIEGSLRDIVWPSISPDGDRVAMSTDAGILVVDAEGGREVLAWPPELEGPFDTLPRVVWLPDDDGFVVLHWKRPWFMGFDGSAEPAPFPATYGTGVMVDPDDGTVRQRRWQRYDLVEWKDGQAENVVSLGGYGERFVTRFGLVAYTGGPPGQQQTAFRSGPVVVDAANGEVVAYAPIKDPSSVYSDNGHLTAKGFLDADTVLLLLTPMNYRTMQPEDAITHLVAWHWRTGDFERLASGGPAMRSIDVAPDLL